MFSHIMIGTNDLDKAKSFYDALLGTLGVKPGLRRPPSHLLAHQDRDLLGDRSRSTARRRPLPMAAPSALRPLRPPMSMPSMRPASPMAARPARTRRASAKAPA